MEPHSIQKLLIGVACAGLGASAHFFLAGNATPPAVTQPVAPAKRERVKPTVEQHSHVRPTAAQAEVKGPRVRPPREEPSTYVPRDRDKTMPKAKKKVQIRAC
jgi:hypothetical protein